MRVGSMLRKAVQVSLLASASLCAGLAAAEEFPAQPIRLVIPYPPGGALSVYGAIITTAAEPHFGQPMVSLIRAG